MSVEEPDDNTADLTVYDLAEKMAAGLPLSSAAQREVAAELLKLKVRLVELARLDNECDCDRGYGCRACTAIAALHAETVPR